MMQADACRVFSEGGIYKDIYIKEKYVNVISQYNVIAAHNYQKKGVSLSSPYPS